MSFPDSARRIPVPSLFTGKLVRISRHDHYEDVFGIYLGSFRTPHWDREGEYTFHSILSSEGHVRNYCMRTDENVRSIIEKLT